MNPRYNNSIWALFGAVLLLCSLVLAGCSNSDDASKSSPSPAAGNGGPPKGKAMTHPPAGRPD